MSAEKLHAKPHRRHRRAKRAVPRGSTLASSVDPFVRRAVELSQQLDGEDVKALLSGVLAKHDAELGRVDDVLLQFDWDTALKLLPFLMEYVDAMRDADGQAISGAEKEERTVAMLLKLSALAKREDFLDEHAIFTLRLVISTAVQVSRGEFDINNPATRRNALQAVGHAVSWALKHCACAGGAN